MKHLILYLFSVTTWAAVQPHEAVIPNNLKFSISEKGTNWEPSAPPSDSASIKLLYRGPARADNVQPSLTVRIETMDKSEKDFKDYFRRWLKEYPKFGYNVLGHKAFILDGRQAYVVDLTSATSGKQARQILAEKDREIVLITCLDDKSEFLSSLPACNKMIKSFSWNKF